MFHIELVSYSRYAQAEGPDIVIDILLAEVPERYKTKAYILSLALYLCQLSKKSRTVFSCGHKVLILDSEEAGHVKEFLNQRLRRGLKVIPLFFRGMMLQSNTATDGECATIIFLILKHKHIKPLSIKECPFCVVGDGLLPSDYLLQERYRFRPHLEADISHNLSDSGYLFVAEIFI